MSDQPACECTQAGWCERYQRQQWERDLHYCRGEGPPHLPPVGKRQQLHYRLKWLREMAGKAPGIARKAANAGRAVGRAIGRLATGKPVLVAPEVAQQRKVVCTANACGLYDAAADTCTHRKCGCGISRRRLALGIVDAPGKTELATERCPVGLW